MEVVEDVGGGPPSGPPPESVKHVRGGGRIGGDGLHTAYVGGSNVVEQQGIVVRRSATVGESIRGELRIVR